MKRDVSAVLKAEINPKSPPYTIQPDSLCVGAAGYNNNFSKQREDLKLEVKLKYNISTPYERLNHYLPLTTLKLFHTNSNISNI